MEKAKWVFKMTPGCSIDVEKIQAVRRCTAYKRVYSPKERIITRDCSSAAPQEPSTRSTPLSLRYAVRSLPEQFWTLLGSHL